MQIAFEKITVTKRHPLRISRGTNTGGVNVLVRVIHDGIEGWGEMAPSSVTGDTAASAERDLTRWADLLTDLAPWEMQSIESCIAGAGGSATHAALDIALHDWLGKRAGMPLYRVLGLDLSRI